VVNSLPMNSSIDLSKFKISPISQIIKGDYLVNLGSVIETEKLETHYCLIIDRLNEKQVFKFETDTLLVTT
jgi:hypothetical protein